MLLIIGVGSHRHRAFRALLRSGLRIGVIALPGSHPCGPLTDLQLFDNPRDPARREAIVAAARRLHAETGIRGVLTLDELSVPTAAAVAADLGLPTITPDTAHIARNKFRMRDLFTQAGLHNPRYAPLHTFDDLRRFAGETGYPLIVKPTDSGGSAGVMRVDSPDQLATAYDNALHSSKTRLLIAEEVIIGPEYSVEAVVWNGRTHIAAITEKQTTDGPYYVELGHTVPAPLPDEAVEQIHRLVPRALQALGITMGAAHLELRLTTEGPVLIEVGARLAGDLIPDLVELATGIDLYSAVIACALGQDPAPHLQPTRKQAASITFLTPPAGLVRNVPNLDTLAGEDDGLVDAELHVRRGDRISSLTANWRRAGHLIVRADTHEQLQQRMTKWQTAYAIDVEKAEEQPHV